MTISWSICLQRAHKMLIHKAVHSKANAAEHLRLLGFISHKIVVIIQLPIDICDSKRDNCS